MTSVKRVKWRRVADRILAIDPLTVINQTFSGPPPKSTMPGMEHIGYSCKAAEIYRNMIRAIVQEESQERKETV